MYVDAHGILIGSDRAGKVSSRPEALTREFFATANEVSGYCTFALDVTVSI
jgi:hypothetical protein